MKNTVLLTFLMILFSGVIFAQNSNSDIKVGDIFIIGEANNYKYIDFPKNNFIIKKGGIANYKKIIGQKVEITALKEKKHGKLIATIKLTSNKKFFNSHKYVTATINEAVNNNELVKI